MKKFGSVLFASFAVVSLLVACASKKVGDACETYRSEECGGGDGATCLGNNAGSYCTIKCNAPTDCPKGFACSGVNSMTVTGKGETKDQKTVKMCTKS